MADKEVLSYVIDVDNKKGIREAAKFQREVDKQIGKVSKSIEKLGKTAHRVSSDAVEDTGEWIDNLGKVGGYYSNEIKEIRRLDNAIGHLKRQREGADKGAQKGIDNQIKALTKQLKRKKAEIAPFDMKAMGAEAKKGMSDAAEGFKGSLRSFFQRDIPGMLKGGGGMAKGFGKMFLSGIGKSGVKLKGLGSGLANKPGGGKATALAGKSLKFVGGGMAKMGAMMGTLAKLGPIIGGIATALMAVVQVMIDADAKAKKFQKTILESASTAEFLAAAGGDTALAYEDLGDAMKSIRDAAFSWENVKWGISSEEHAAVISSLTQEGVSLKRITQEAAVAKKEVGEFAAELTHVGVAYARTFGISLQEVTKFQGEMMTDLGMGLEETKLAFTQMSRAATDSGIAANRFYNIIRGVSQDLSMYNVRMGSAIKLLKMLGKVMNPREAQKFMQSAAQGLKNMGQDERLKVALLAGKKGKKILDKDLDNRRQKLYDRIGKAIGEEGDAVADQLAKDPKALWNKVREKAGEQAGGLRGEALELKIDTAAAGKGVYGQAFAMENLGMGASLDTLTAALGRFGGGGSLLEGAGSLGMTKMAEMLGIGTQQLRGMMKLEVAVKEQRSALLAQAEKELAVAKTAEEKASAERKIQIAKSGDTQDILDTMDKAEQDALKEGTKSQMDFAKEQGKMTQSLVDKLGVLVDFVMNQVYNAMLGIWEGIMSIPGVGNKEQKDRLERIKAARTVEGPAKEAMMKAASSTKKFQTAVQDTDLGKQFMKAMREANQPDEGVKAAEKKAYETLERYGQGKATDTELAAAKKAVEDAKKASAERQEGVKAMQDKLLASLSPAALGQLVQGPAMKEMAPGGKYTKEAAYGIARGSGASHEEAMKRAGITQEEMRALLSNAPMMSDPKQLMNLMSAAAPDLEKLGYYTGEKSEEEKKAAEATAVSTAEGAKATSHLDAEATKNGTLYVKFSNSFLNEYEKTVHDAVLDALRTGLFEYWMYSDMDRGEVSQHMRESGMSVADFVKPFSSELMTGEDLYGLGGGGGDKPKPKQHGGLVTHIQDGVAVVRPPPPGEGYTPIGRGEEIRPAYARGRGGAGGGTQYVHITLDPNARQLIRAQVMDGIYEYKQRERNT